MPPQPSPLDMDEADNLDPTFTDDLLEALSIALPSPANQTDREKHRRFAAASIALRAFDAQDPIEAMLAAHAVLAHQFTLECYRRAARSSQGSNFETGLLDTAAMLTRTMTGTLQTLEQRQDDPIWVGPPGNVQSCR